MRQLDVPGQSSSPGNGAEPRSIDHLEPYSQSELAPTSLSSPARAQPVNVLDPAAPGMNAQEIAALAQNEGQKSNALRDVATALAARLEKALAGSAGPNEAAVAPEWMGWVAEPGCSLCRFPALEMAAITSPLSLGALEPARGE